GVLRDVAQLGSLCCALPAGPRAARLALVSLVVTDRGASVPAPSDAMRTAVRARLRVAVVEAGVDARHPREILLLHLRQEVHVLVAVPRHVSTSLLVSLLVPGLVGVVHLEPLCHCVDRDLPLKLEQLAGHVVKLVANVPGPRLDLLQQVDLSERRVRAPTL